MLNQKNKNTTGISNALVMTSEVGRESSAIVFEGPVNIKLPNDGIIRFPDDDKASNKSVETDDDNIDLSGSFTPSKNNTSSHSSSSGTFANCVALGQRGTFSFTSSHSGVFTFPNGTQVFFSNCHAIQIVDTSG